LRTPSPHSSGRTPWALAGAWARNATRCPKDKDIKAPLTVGARITELQPASGKACPTQTGQDWRATAHDLPQQPGAMILDHQHHRTLIDAEVIRRNPPAGRTAFYGERLIERRQESVFSHHAQIQLGKIAHSRYDN